MNNSPYLARLIGPVLVAAGASMLINPQTFLDIATGMIADAALLYFTAVLGLLGGIALVLAHNVWAADWRVIITLLGWVSIVDSTTWILAPRALARFWAPTLTPGMPMLAGAIVLILGAVLCYFGYFATAAAKRSTGRRR